MDKYLQEGVLGKIEMLVDGGYEYKTRCRNIVSRYQATEYVSINFGRVIVDFYHLEFDGAAVDIVLLDEEKIFKLGYRRIDNNKESIEFIKRLYNAIGRPDMLKTLEKRYKSDVNVVMI